MIRGRTRRCLQSQWSLLKFGDGERRALLSLEGSPAGGSAQRWLALLLPALARPACAAGGGGGGGARALRQRQWREGGGGRGSRG